MNLASLNNNHHTNIHFSSVYLEVLSQRSPVKKGVGQFLIGDQGQLLFVQEENYIHFGIKRQAEAQEFFLFLQRGSPHLVEIKQVIGKFALVDIYFFDGIRILPMGDIEIGYNDELKKRLQKQNLLDNNLAIEDSLKNQFLIPNPNEAGKYWFLVSAGPSISQDFNDYSNEKHEKHTPIHQDLQSFSLFGEDIRIPVQLKTIKEGFEEREIFFAARSIKQKTNNHPLLLAEGSISFLEEEEVKQAGYQNTQYLKQLTTNDGSFLKTWTDIHNIEIQFLLEKFYGIGLLQEDSPPKQREPNIEFTIRLTKEIPAHLERGDVLEFHYSDYFLEVLEPITDVSEFIKECRERKKSKRTEASFEVKYIDHDNQVIRIKSTNPNEPIVPPADGVPFRLHYSLEGDITQIERRENAQKRILEHSSGISALGLILEEGGEKQYQPRLPTKKFRPLSDSVTKKIFAHPPTPNQKDAVEAALNTPDIAIIQGPPGTGKTTVITAIIERLNEDSNKLGAITGKVLVSGYQHDAVDNLISRLSINDLPTWKYGKKQNNDNTQQIDRLEQWCLKVIQNLRQKNADLEQTEQEKQLFLLWKNYHHHPSKPNAIHLLQGVLNQSSFKLPRALKEKIQNKLKEVKQTPLTSSPDQILKHIYRIRTTKAGFYDDGPEQIQNLCHYFELQGIPLDVQWKEVFQEIAQAQEITPSLGKDLARVKKEMIKAFSPKTEYQQELWDNEILDLNNEINKALTLDTPSSEVDRVLVDYLQELEYNFYGVAQALQDYNYVYAATVQQSQKHDIIKAKEASGSLLYDTVIIDEAARCGPLDLLIPMTQASKRIILVGDHRQLPHMLDEKIAKTYEEGLDLDKDEEQQSLSMTLFEHLRNRCKELERIDGINRRVTLNAQFRTHPTLGRFLSKYFYEVHGEEEKFGSPLEADNFAHHIFGIEDKAAIWVDIPWKKQKEFIPTKPKTSWHREIEARWIGMQVHKLLAEEQYQDLSIGVISFYSEQINTIMKALSAHNITDNRKGYYDIRPEYRLNEKGHERLRIGTVDSFQGMEFDIVFLSMVRSANLEKLHPQKPTRDFGHLMSENRLCVSMSRQKKLLIVVGDGQLATSEHAEKNIPELYAFHHLCQNDPHGMIIDNSTEFAHLRMRYFGGKR